MTKRKPTKVAPKVNVVAPKKKVYNNVQELLDAGDAITPEERVKAIQRISGVRKTRM